MTRHPFIAISSVLLLWSVITATSAAAPHFDLHAAVAAAAPGSTIHVPVGVYRGPLVIDKPLTLIGRPGATLDGGQSGDVVRINAAHVTLQGFIIEGSGISLDQENAGVTVRAPYAVIENNTLRDVLFGIYCKKSDHSVIRNNTIGGKHLGIARRGDGIRLWYCPDSIVEGNDVDHSRDVVLWFSNRLTIRNNTVADGRYGLHFMFSDDNVIESNHIERNSVGAFLMYSRRLTLRRNTFEENRGPSGYGVGLKDMDGITAEDNRFIGNRVGLYIDNSPREIDITHHFTRNLFACNDVGVAFMPSVQRNVFVANSFMDNFEQVAVLGEGKFTGNSFTENGRGNFWSDYAGYDLNHDGRGDLAYAPRSLFENLMDRQPKLRLFAYSPAQQAVELAARALPALRPQPKFTDSAPLMAPVPVDQPPISAAAAWPMSASAGTLFAAAGLVMAGVRRRFPMFKPRRPVRSEPADAVNHDLSPTAIRASGSLVEVNDLTCRFGRFVAIDHLSFNVRPGESVALWGHNGAGKTTAIRSLLGLVRSSGTIRIAGHDLHRDGNALRAAVGYMPQELCFYDNWSGVETLRFFARIKRVGDDRVSEALRIVGLTDHADKAVAAMSGGMKQRLALASALLSDPPLLVLDEMTSNLDSTARGQFTDLLAELKRRGKTLVFASHRIEEVAALADRVIVLEAGRIKTECTPAELPAAIGLRPALRVVLEANQVDDAARVLREAGFAGVELSVESERIA